AGASPDIGRHDAPPADQDDVAAAPRCWPAAAGGAGAADAPAAVAAAPGAPPVVAGGHARPGELVALRRAGRSVDGAAGDRPGAEAGAWSGTAGAGRVARPAEVAAPGVVAAVVAPGPLTAPVAGAAPERVPAPLPEDEAEITDATGDMLRGVNADEEIDEIDEQPERLRRPLPYTWLQWIILAVVAFVLGFLIIFVANTASDRAAGPDVPATAATAPDAAP
ncbi:hypothetical protein G6556_06975, partial [Cellulomonas sp. IC4_254]|nr:hypothetical protein [Cellulomonas sp. IC4_254]